MLTSDVLGSWWKRLPPGEDPDAAFGEGAVGYPARVGTREAMALLRALAVLGVTPAQPDAAGCGATPSSATSLPTRTILITLNESTLGANRPALKHQIHNNLDRAVLMCYN